MRRVVYFAALLLCISLFRPELSVAVSDYSIRLSTGAFEPQPMSAPSQQVTSALVDKHILMQFDRVITQAEKEQLKSDGIILLEFVPSNTWIVRLENSISSADYRSNDIRWLGEILPEQKIAAVLTESGIPEWAIRDAGRAQFAVVVHADEDPYQWAEQFRSVYNAEILGVEPSARIIELIVPELTYLSLAGLDAVQWVEPALPYPKEHNSGCRDNMSVTALQTAPYNLSGENIVVAQWDGGKAWDGHDDFSGRLIPIDASATSYHATHVAGTIIGDGTRLYANRGMAPQATLLSQQWFNSATEAFNEYQSVISLYGATASNNSWGYGVSTPSPSACAATLGNYYTINTTIDNLVRGSASSPISIIWSAGNVRATYDPSECGSIGWVYNTVQPPSTSKNVICVGAINSNNNSMTSFSSWGPCDDGRIKPDVVAPGCQSSQDYGVTSTNTSNWYSVECGTSMSAPAVTGAVALMYEQYLLTNGSLAGLFSSTIKGIIINSATDLGQPGPDYSFGHGKVEALKAVKKILYGTPSYVQGDITTSQVLQYDLVVPGGAPSLKVSLVWDDPGGTAISGSALINDLDLELIDPFGAVTASWILDPANPSWAATRGANRIDNVETAEVSLPTAGIWRARVTGYNIPQGPQNFSLIFTPDSIYQPGTSLASTVYTEGDQTILPGNTTPVNFWVSNIGAVDDSLRIRVTDDHGWLVNSVDTSVFLSQYDSIYIATSVTVPIDALAGDSTLVTCRANSKTDTLAGSQNATEIEAATTYAIAFATPPLDTANSPETYSAALKVYNNGNGSSGIFVTFANDSNWQIYPTQRFVSVPARDSATVTFDIYVPAELPHQSTHTTKFFASGDGATADTSTFALFVLNPFPPPALLSPDTALYTQNGRVSFEWSDISDSYSLRIALDSNMTIMVKSYPGLTSASFTLPAPDSLADGLYYWAVKAFSGSDSSSYQRHPRRVLVDNIAPSTHTPYFPSANSILDLKIFEFSYSQAVASGLNTAPESSAIQVARDSLFTDIVVVAEPVFGTNHTPTDTLPDDLLYWRIVRSDLAGNVSISATAPNFIVDSRPPDLPIMVYPDSGASVSQAPIPLRWDGTPPVAHAVSGEYYYVQVSATSAFSANLFANFVYADSLLLDSPPLEQSTTYYWRVKAIDSAGNFTAYTGIRSFAFGCCSGTTGNVNMAGIVDGGDLALLVAYLTNAPGSKPTLSCPEEANVNASGIIDGGDLALLVAYLTNPPGSKPALPDCP